VTGIWNWRGCWGCCCRTGAAVAGAAVAGAGAAVAGAALAASPSARPLFTCLAQTYSRGPVKMKIVSKRSDPYDVRGGL